ncbi:MAG: UvrD-helicase domain-containing protein, partial [Lachnospiraceae bacterium]|nr:UvrD-helicase domain-containing protein [Candidatus Colinaster equi]
MRYNTEQLEAINHTDGPALIIAGPGSGKTSVLTARIRHLILNKGVMPEQILVITFSKAAAIEMQTRFNNLCKDNFYPVNFGTFHSVFFHILQNEYHYTAKNIISLKQKRNTILCILRNLNIVQYAECELLDNLINAISYYKNTNCKIIP